MRLSKNFILSEFTKSQEAIRRGINNSAPQQVIDNLVLLCENVLEPIREEFGAVSVSSGYRSPQLNRMIGGSTNSQHVYGEAADIEVYGVDNCDLAKWIADNLDFDQLILEFHVHEEGPNSGWVHVSYAADTNRQQILTASRINGRVVYDRGFPWE